MPNLRFGLFSALLGLVSTALQGAVVKLVVEHKEPFQNQAQAYEKLTGRFYGELDPALPLNAIITDLEFAPRNARGMVDYSATFTILKPVDLSKASGVLAYQVPNRGTTNIEGGSYWADFRARGHIVVASGWQADIAPRPGIETLLTPIAKNADGSSITGPVMARIVNPPAGSTTQPIIRGRVTGTATPASLDTSKALLTRRTSEEGARVPVKPADWAFGDCSKVPFPGEADPFKLCLKGGFDPAYLYELTYIAKDPPIHGIGFAATRDLNAFLRHASNGNPLGSAIQYTIAQGTSQSGNYLRSFLNLGFNQDELGRRVFDGMNPNIAARQLAMNIRFAAPSGAADMYEPGSEGVVWWAETADEARGHKPAGLLSRCAATETCPKIVETFGSAEFYSLRMSPDLVGTHADHDIPLPSNVRRYYSPSVRHGGGPGGFNVDIALSDCCVLPSNPNSSGETNRAILQALVDWVAKDAPPPPSRYPRLDHGDLVPPTQAALGFPAIPGRPLPDGVHVPFFQYAFGSGFHESDESGVISMQPPVVRQTLPLLMPRVDADGNETSGVRSVLLEAPLGTYTGWNPIARGFFKGDIDPLGGGYIPFAKTKADRLASGDPRMSLEERYGTHDNYVAQVKSAAAKLVEQRYLLQEDADRLVAQAEKSSVLR